MYLMRLNSKRELYGFGKVLNGEHRCGAVKFNVFKPCRMYECLGGERPDAGGTAIVA
jgi:hypothetical protein